MFLKIPFFKFIRIIYNHQGGEKIKRREMRNFSCFDNVKFPRQKNRTGGLYADWSGIAGNLAGARTGSKMGTPGKCEF